MAFLLATLHVALPVEAKPVNPRWAFMDRKDADAAEASPGDLCFVETGKGKAKRRTAYILDFDGQCRAAVSAAHHKKKLRQPREQIKMRNTGPREDRFVAPVILEKASNYQLVLNQLASWQSKGQSNP